MPSKSPTPAAESYQSRSQKGSQAARDEGESGHGLLYILTILGLALGAIGTFLAMQARKENQAIMRDNQDDINNMQKQIDKMRAALKGGAVAASRQAPRTSYQCSNLDEKDGISTTQED